MHAEMSFSVYWEKHLDSYQQIWILWSLLNAWNKNIPIQECNLSEWVHTYHIFWWRYGLGMDNSPRNAPQKTKQVRKVIHNFAHLWKRGGLSKVKMAG